MEGQSEEKNQAQNEAQMLTPTKTISDEGKSAGLSPKKPSLTMDDFTHITSLGRGAYGEVILVQKKSNDKQYAMKIIDKNFMRREQKEYQVFAEKDVLFKLNNHPGVVKLFFLFQDKNKLYFVMEFLCGGEFSDYLRVQKGKLEASACKFYAAEMVSILEYMHKNGIAHRDFKPENLMLSEEGHVKAIDFGTAKYINSEKRPSEMFRKSKDEPLTTVFSDPEVAKKYEHRSTFVGTAQYVSPEMLEDSECSAPADIWALGCVIYYMCAGRLPFFAPSEYLLFQQIKQMKIQWPEDMDPVSKDLLERMLVRNPTERLGAGAEGSSNDFNALKAHPFFKDINFETIYQQDSPMLNSKALQRTPIKGDLPIEMEFARASLESTRLSERFEEDESRISLSDAIASKGTLMVTVTQSDNLFDQFKVVLTGQVDKKSPYLFYQLRQLVLTDEPRLKYYNPETNELRNEIPVSSILRAEAEGKVKFHIITASRKYTFKSIDHPAEKWVKAINSQCTLHRKESL